MKKVLFFTLILLPSILFSSTGWQPMQQITDNRVMDMMPSIDITPEGQPVIAAHEIIPEKKYDIFVFEPKNGKWESTNITNTPMVSDYQPVIKSDSKGNLHVFYLSRLASKDNKLFVFYTCRVNGKKYDNYFGTGARPFGDINTSGTYWTPQTCLTISKQDNAAESRPAVAIDRNDNVHVVVPDDKGRLIYLMKDYKGWNPMEFITVTTDSINWYPSIAMDKYDFLHVIYLGGNDPDYSIKHIMKMGQTWTNPELVVDSTWKCWHPNLSISSNGTLNIVFACDNPLQRNIAFLKYNPFSKPKLSNPDSKITNESRVLYNINWTKPIRVTQNDSDYDYPTATEDYKGNTHIVFHGGVGGNEGNYKIYYTNNISGNFIKPLALTNDNIYQYNPVIAIDKDGYGYIAYYGFDGYDTELFLQKSEKRLNQLTDLSGQAPYRDFPEHKKRYLPPVDLNNIPSAATTLNGKKITISAGHGGWAYLAEYRYGATNSREGDFNFQVADYLRQYLEKTGVTVYMCRTTDMDIPLYDRPGLANNTNSDLFISIHHNADDFYSNYASVYYHADPDYDPVGLDIARYTDKEIVDLLNIPDQGVMSDYYSYWNAGYAELRGLKDRPGILGEGSHFYCFEEEEQLRNLDYLKREAYAYFLALIKYYSAEHPTAKLIEPSGESGTNRPQIKIQLNEGSTNGLHKIIPSSIQLKLDGKQILFNYDWRTGILTYQPTENLKMGGHTLELFFMNFDKISSGKTILNFKVSP